MRDMAGMTDLTQLLRSLEPVLRSGEFVYATVLDLPAGLPVEATVREPEGLTVVLRRDVADAHGIAYDYVGTWDGSMVAGRWHPRVTPYYGGPFEMWPEDGSLELNFEEAHQAEPVAV